MFLTQVQREPALFLLYRPIIVIDLEVEIISLGLYQEFTQKSNGLTAYICT